MRLEVSLAPFGVTIHRGGRRLLGPIGVRVRDGAVHDHFVRLTEGVLDHEELGDPVDAVAAEPVGAGAWRLRLADGSGARLQVTRPGPEHVRLQLLCDRPALRLAFTAPGHPEQRFTGLGARHGLHFDQAGRELQLGADRRYTGPDCPPDMLEVGGIPQGDYAPVPWLLASRGWAAWLETDGHGARFALGDELAISARAAAGPLVLHVFTHATRRRGCGRSCGSRGCQRCCPSGRTGTGRAATSTSISATWRRTSRATASTGCRSTRSSSTRRGRRSTTPGSSTRTSSPTRPG
jgi:hypothetical protein